MQFDHEIITVGLGKDGGSGDGHHLAVTFDDGLMGEVFEGVEAVAVDEQELGADGQRADGAMHGFDAGF